jgi:hypothetical protein
LLFYSKTLHNNKPFTSYASRTPRICILYRTRDPNAIIWSFILSVFSNLLIEIHLICPWQVNPPLLLYGELSPIMVRSISLHRMTYKAPIDSSVRSKTNAEVARCSWCCNALLKWSINYPLHALLIPLAFSSLKTV